MILGGVSDLLSLFVCFACYSVLLMRSCERVWGSQRTAPANDIVMRLFALCHCVCATSDSCAAALRRVARVGCWVSVFAQEQRVYALYGW